MTCIDHIYNNIQYYMVPFVDNLAQIQLKVTKKQIKAVKDGPVMIIKSNENYTLVYLLCL